jgi:hypothetical protein
MLAISSRKKCTSSSGSLTWKLLHVLDSAIEALASQHTDLDLHHVEPAGMLGDIMEVQTTQHPSASSAGKLW